jgi:hypothetical protein
VQVHYDEGVANHIGPEPCVGIREDVGEASAGERAGQPLSRDRELILGADAVCVAEGNMSKSANASTWATWSRRRTCHARTLLHPRVASALPHSEGIAYKPPCGEIACARGWEQTAKVWRSSWMRGPGQPALPVSPIDRAKPQKDRDHGAVGRCRARSGDEQRAVESSKPHANNLPNRRTLIRTYGGVGGTAS